MNAATQNTWNSYRDGRRVMHYIEDGKGRFYVQKTAAGYHVSAYSNSDKWTQVHMTTAATLAAGKKWVEEHIEAQNAVGRLALAEVVAKSEDETLYECEIPGAPGRITHGARLEKSLQAVRQVALLPYQVEVAERLARFKRHRPKLYNTLHLGIDKFKVFRDRSIGDRKTLDDLCAQDARVCRIEQELLQYEGKKRTPHRDRKVARLVRILRALKRGLYE